MLPIQSPWVFPQPLSDPPIGRDLVCGQRLPSQALPHKFPVLLFVLAGLCFRGRVPPWSPTGWEMLCEAQLRAR